MIIQDPRLQVTPTLRTLGLCLAFSLFSGCEFLSTQYNNLISPSHIQPQRLPAQTVSSPIEESPTTVAVVPADGASNRSSIELLWEKPEHSVENYIISYGTDRSALDQTVTLRADQLDVVKDPTHGEVFHHVIRGVAKDQSLFVQIVAQTGNSLSTPTDVIEIKPKEASDPPSRSSSLSCMDSERASEDRIREQILCSLILNAEVARLWMVHDNRRSALLGH